MNTSDRRVFVAGMAAKYSDRLRRFLKFRLRNPSDVSDLAQEVFMRLLRVPHHEDIRSPEAYLFTVASHVIQQHQQKQVAISAPLEWIEALAEATINSSDEPPAKVELQLALQGRALDWWRFWLLNEEDTDEGKREQYTSWHVLRDQHAADLSHPRSPRLKWFSKADADVP